MSLNLGKFLSLEGEDLLAVDLRHPLKRQGPVKHLTSCRIRCLKLLKIGDTSSGTSGGTPLAKRSDFARVTPDSLGPSWRELL